MRAVHDDEERVPTPAAIRSVVARVGDELTLMADGSFDHEHKIAGVAVTLGDIAVTATLPVGSSAAAELAAVGLACCVADFCAMGEVVILTDLRDLVIWMRTPSKWRGTTPFAKLSGIVAEHPGWLVRHVPRAENQAHRPALRALRGALVTAGVSGAGSA